MVFVTRRKLAEKVLNHKWTTYIAHKNSNDELRHSEWLSYYAEYRAAEEVILSMGYWPSRDEHGKHTVLRRSFRRFRSE